MFRVLMFVFANAMVLASAYPEPTTTVHIQKHEGPIYVSPDRCDNPVTIGNRYPGNQNQSPLYHPYHTCETDCKCVSKHINTCVPINTVPQNTCTPGTYYCCPNYGCPDYSSGCPDYGYGYGYSEGRDGCPIASDGLIPLLKSYLGQSKCPKHGYQCGQSYVSY